MERVIKGILLCISLCFFILFAYKINDYVIEERESRGITEDLVEIAVIKTEEQENEQFKESTIPITVDFQELKKKNENIIAWLYAQNTEINYPIVQGKDNEEYLHKLINGKNNKAGTLFIDYRNSKDLTDENTIIYGHNMKNGTMFGCLDEYKKQSYYEEHKMMYLLTEEKNYKIELFAGYTLPANSKIYNVSAVSNSKEEMITSAKQKSTFQSDTEINENERIVTLSTCSYEYDEARYVVMGVLREI